MDANDLFGHELLAALQGLDPAAAPLVVALIGHGCIALPDAAIQPVLDLLRTVADQAVDPKPDDVVKAAQLAMVTGWLESQAAHSGKHVSNPQGWAILRELGCEREAQAATVFALVVASSVNQHARLTSGTDDGVTLH